MVHMPQGLTTAPVNHAPPWPAGYLAVRGETGAHEQTIAKCLGRVRRRRARGIRAGRGETWGTRKERPFC